MEKVISRVVEVKEGRKWSISRIVNDAAEIYRALSDDLAAKYINKAAYVKRITRACNYNGTQTITVLYDNGVRSLYTVED